MSEFESSSSGSVVTTTRGFEASAADGPPSAWRAAVEQPASVMPIRASVIERRVVIAETPREVVIAYTGRHAPHSRARSGRGHAAPGRGRIVAAKVKRERSDDRHLAAHSDE